MTQTTHRADRAATVPPSSRRAIRLRTLHVHCGDFAAVRGTMRKLAVGAILALTTMVIPVAIATPASATEAQCVDYLRREDILIGPKVKGACDKGASSVFAVRQLCFPMLVEAGVSGGKAGDACYYAYW
jgi:hypothetical protein